MEKILVPAAQYLRMSTEHQQYSFANQADAIARYAIEHGFQIAKTYSDGAKSGLRIMNRPGLKQVLKDVFDVSVQSHSRVRREPLGPLSGCRRIGPLRIPLQIGGCSGSLLSRDFRKR